MKRKCGFEENAATFSRLPVEPLSMQMTWSPRFKKLSHRCEPMKPAPPVISTLAIAPSYGEVSKAHFAQIFRIVNIAPVENDGLLQQLLDEREVRAAEFVPFGHDKKRVGALEGVVIAAEIADAIAEDLFRFVHRFRVVRMDDGAGLQERFGDDDGRGVAHIVGARLERKAPQRESLAFEILAEVPRHLFDQ